MTDMLPPQSLHAILKWADAGGDPKEGYPYSVLLALNKDGLVALQEMSTMGRGNGLLISLSGLGKYELERLDHESQSTSS